MIGATYDLRMNAATMPSSATPSIARNPYTLFVKIGMMLLLAGAAVALRQFMRARTLHSA